MLGLIFKENGDRVKAEDHSEAGVLEKKEDLKELVAERVVDLAEEAGDLDVEARD